MAQNLYVGNLPPDTTAKDLRALFGLFGYVQRSRVAADRQTGLSRGFGFVEMAHGAAEAVRNLHRSELKGRALTVVGAGAGWP